MSWRDFFYFSKGERSGLIVLLCLITIAGILLILNQSSEHEFVTGLEQEVFSSSSSPDSSFRSDVDIVKQKKLVDPSENKVDNSGKKISAPEKRDFEPERKKESVPERVERLTSYSRPSYPRAEKFPEGTVVELNTADTTLLKKVPGIGSAFARRIINYRNLLGGYYSVTQLSEVYGIDEDKYNALVSWFRVDPSFISGLNVNNLPQDSLRRHPYINYGQAKIITQLRRQKGKLTGWENLLLLNEFTDGDKIRLQHYLSFE